MPETMDRIDRTREPELGELTAQVDGLRESAAKDHDFLKETAIKDYANLIAFIDLHVSKLDARIDALKELSARGDNECHAQLTYAKELKAHDIQRLGDEISELRSSVDFQFKSAETAVAAALVAQEKLTAASFASGEKAILKAEEAQKDYNVRSNEFRGQLDDQAKMLMPRAEAQALVNSLDDKIETMKGESDNRKTAIETSIISLHSDLDKDHDTLRDNMDNRLKSLESNRANLDGRMWAIGAAISAAVVILNIVLYYFSHH